MKIAIIGGTGAMGSAFGAALTQGGNDVTLVDVVQEAVDLINERGVTIRDGAGAENAVQIKATTDPGSIGKADLVLVFVKCYHTEAAIAAAKPMFGPDTVVLSLQNGWGNAQRISDIAGAERVLVGVTYHSAALLGPGHVLHAGRGATFIGELNGAISDRLETVADVFQKSELDVTASPRIVDEIWKKLALNVCTLPTSSLLRLTAGELPQHEGVVSLMRVLLDETKAVAKAKGIELDQEERWNTINAVLARAGAAKSSMLQDVEKQRRTEIDVINGAIVAAGREAGVPTPHNDTMVWLIKSLEETFA